MACCAADGDDERHSFVLLHAALRGDARPSVPTAAHFTPARLPLTERWMTILWQRLNLPLPVEWFSGPIDLFHAPDFVLPPVRRAPTVLTVHDLAFLLYPECADARLRDYLMAAVPRSVRERELRRRRLREYPERRHLPAGRRARANGRGPWRRRAALPAGDGEAIAALRQTPWADGPVHPDRRA